MGAHAVANLTAQVETAAARSSLGISSVNIWCGSTTKLRIHGAPTFSVGDGLRLITALGITEPTVEHFGKGSDPFSTVEGVDPSGVAVHAFCRYEGPLDEAAVIEDPVEGPLARAVGLVVESAAGLGIGLKSVAVSHYTYLSIDIHPEGYDSLPVAEAVALVQALGVAVPTVRQSPSRTTSTVAGQNPDGLTVNVFCRFEDRASTS